MSIRAFSCRIASRPTSPKIQNPTLQNLPRGPSLSISPLYLSTLTSRSVPATTVPVAVLCILRLVSNVNLQKHPAFRLPGKCSRDLFVFLCVYVCLFLLAYVMYTSILGCSWSFLIFLFCLLGVACCITGIAWKSASEHELEHQRGVGSSVVLN